jgi:hypothetical protein
MLSTLDKIKQKMLGGKHTYFSATIPDKGVNQLYTNNEIRKYDYCYVTCYGKTEYWLFTKVEPCPYPNYKYLVTYEVK